MTGVSIDHRCKQYHEEVNNVETLVSNQPILVPNQLTAQSIQSYKCSLFQGASIIYIMYLLVLLQTLHCVVDPHHPHIINCQITIAQSSNVSEIEEGNWLSLQEAQIDVPEGGFDAVICLGNSFAHLPDFQGDLGHQKLAVQNFKDMLKPGGVLFIDHRNYDAILDSGKAPSRNLYYNVSFLG